MGYGAGNAHIIKLTYREKKWVANFGVDHPSMNGAGTEAYGWYQVVV